MDLREEVKAGLTKAEKYVAQGVEQIVKGTLDESHGVSISPGATALASLALLAIGGGFEQAQKQSADWLGQNQQVGWGKFPGDKPDEEVTRIVSAVLEGSEGGWLAKVRLLARARQFSQMILSLGERVVPGLEGPSPEEIVLPDILAEKVLAKLPLYGRPVVVAAAILAADSEAGVEQGVHYLLDAQMPDGSWAEDIVATSLGILALLRQGGNREPVIKAGEWLTARQYPGGAWPAFDQLKIWAVAWMICVFGENPRPEGNRPWFNEGLNWLLKAQNSDGSFGSTPPHTHPDLDDTAVALMALHQVRGGRDPRGMERGIELLRRLQNPDGSWGTFPSFQGKPPEIKSGFPVYIPSVDVSIHVLEALGHSLRTRERVVRGLNWLLSRQDAEGAFPASWFEGGVYSTAQALELLGKWQVRGRFLTRTPGTIPAAGQKALEYLLKSQKSDGGWGSVVETGLALSGLEKYAGFFPKEVLDRGLRNLLEALNPDGSFAPAYRGIYAKGWNYEEPLTSALTAIRAFQRYERLFERNLSGMRY